MIIRNNVSAINTWSSLKLNNNELQKSLEKLSSGLRINKAGDDAAGLAISEKMRGQIRGLGQAARNIQDAGSLVQTAEGGMQEAHSLLQRGRELAVQAVNDTNTARDREAIQKEIEQIIKEIDRIGRTTEFNTIKLLDKATSDPQKTAIIQLLTDQWLGNAEDLITNRFGLSGDGVNLSIILEEGDVGGVLAYVSASVPPTGLGMNLELHVHMADYRAGNIDDRIIAHEMVHAVLNRTVNVGYTTGIPTWFNEGLAEFIHGADERLANELGALGGNTAANRATIAANGTNAWGSTSQDYAGAYAAVKYIHQEIIASGGTGVQDMLAYLSADTTRTLDQAFTNATSGAFLNTADFNTKWGADGETFIAGLNLADADTGSIGGGDDASVVPDVIPAPTSNFNLILPDTTPTGSGPLTFHLGSNSSQIIDVSISKIDSTELGIKSVDLVSNASQAIDRFDSAINAISAERTKLGAIQNRLEHALSITKNNEENLSASESRIRDTDMAKQMMEFTKINILQQGATSMLTQANQTPQAVLKLIS
ncbi:flagellinolysin [Paenibacillus sp. GD4]|uniref:flagellinolysin n=1 Tax=Paenibacillus sp. GD4 TaxID=3068890 RepID=UPI00279665F9|nr:flagellinolysin [Paenibacillus sp. GD4]MDQ1911301.1 flagellinolysin [Paenibacillus sp. GD4]